MFGSTILEVAIGLLFVYLLLSLLCSAVGEYIEAKFNNRAKYLKEGITLLLNDTAGGGVDLAAQLYAHGLVRPFYRDGTKLPSYIPCSHIRAGLVEHGVDGGGRGRVRWRCRQRRRRRHGRLESGSRSRGHPTPESGVEDGSVDAHRRSPGGHREGAQKYRGVVRRDDGSGFWLVQATHDRADVAARVRGGRRCERRHDQHCEHAGARRRAPVLAGRRGRTAHQDPIAHHQRQGARQRKSNAQATKNLQSAHDAVNALGLPIGWTRATPSNKDDRRRVPETFGDFFLKLVGILVTGFAISQGAPFWFDVLNKFMVVRSTVKPSEKSGEQPSKDRPAPKTEIETGEAQKAEPPKG